MAAAVRLDTHGPVTTITLDDGKVNALSPATFAAIGDALDEAERAGTVVVLAGRAGVFSAGFDLSVLRGDDPRAAVAMVRDGFELAARLLTFPTPVVAACTGHAIAMGAFTLLSADYRIGADGSFTIAANEVAIGLTVPYAGVEVCRQRLTPAAFNRAVVLAEPFSPADAVTAGFLDRVVAPDEVVPAAQALARSLAALDLDAHAATKLRVRAEALAAIRAGIDAELVGA
jgi:enoyl-CoA hydratase